VGGDPIGLHLGCCVGAIPRSLPLALARQAQPGPALAAQHMRNLI
jgi:hypothetical protein